MIVCLDTSCLVKLYVEEADSALVREKINQADAVFSSVVAYPEMRGAFRRRRTEGSLSGASTLRALRQFDKDWAAMSRISVTDAIAEDAGDLAAAHALRGMDAIHLATALMVRREAGALISGVRFLTSDARLAEAARKEKFLLLKD